MQRVSAKVWVQWQEKEEKEGRRPEGLSLPQVKRKSVVPSFGRSVLVSTSSSRNG